MDTTATPVISRRQIAGVTLGNALEFYDFLVFAFFAVQIGGAFFPKSDPQAGLLAALATFGAGFLTRPLGAVVLGRLGDRIGRRPMLVLTFALIGGCNLAVAVMPSYAAIGLAAPIAVIACRLVQGFALGGEVGASTALLLEAAPVHRRGLYVAMQFVGQNGAVLVTGLIGLGLSAWLGEAMLARWGWRIAMGIGVAIVPIGLALRSTLPETLVPPVAAAAAPPVASYARLVVIALCTLLANTIGTYVMNYMTTYAQTTLRLPSGVAFGATVMVGIAGVGGAVVAGMLSDRQGRRPWMLWPMGIGTVAVVPAFWLIVAHPGAATLWPVALGLRFVFAAASTAALVHVAESFPARVRSGGIAIVYAAAISVFGGSTQFVVAWLIQVTGDPLSPAWYTLAASLLGFVAMLLARESAPVKVGYWEDRQEKG